jgi:hypothetical protein
VANATWNARPEHDSRITNIHSLSSVPATAAWNSPKSTSASARLAGGEPGGADAALAAVGLAGGDFTLQARDQEILVRPGLRAGPLGEPGHRLAQGGGFQRPGQERDLAGQVAGRRLGGHQAAPPSALMPSTAS